MNLESVYSLFATHPESRWIMKPSNARRLYKFVKANDIKRVLDLGTGIGCTASIIAFALEEKKVDYHIDTVEQYDKCITIAKKLIPEDYQKNISFLKANAMTWQTDKIPHCIFSVYDVFPKGDYDFWINDGPSDIPNKEYWINLPNGTVLQKLEENKIKPGTFILFDGRETSVGTVERYYGGNFYLINPDEKDNNAKIIQRKDNAVIFEDIIRESMVQQGFYAGLQ